MTPLLAEKPIYRDACLIAKRDRFEGIYFGDLTMSQRLDLWLYEDGIVLPLFHWAIKRLVGEMRGGHRGLSIALWQPGPPFVKKLILSFEENLWMWYKRSGKLVGSHNRKRWYRQDRQRKEEKRKLREAFARDQGSLAL